MIYFNRSTLKAFIFTFLRLQFTANKDMTDGEEYNNADSNPEHYRPI